MAHPFKDKLFVFIGTPECCTRQSARDTLVAAGSTPDERITYYTDYVFAFEKAGTAKAYQLALEHERKGSLILLYEKQFFDVLDGKVGPHEKPKRNYSNCKN